MGLGDYEKRRARELAGLGYLAFAIDIYGRGIRARNTEEAGKLAAIYKTDRKEMRARAKGALDFISSHLMFDENRVSAMGYCFGGTVALEMARAGFPLKGVVSFHGGLDTSMPAQKAGVKAKVLVLHGADDTYVSAKDVDAFEQEMRTAGVDWQFVKFGGAVHGFSKKEAGDNVASGYAYNAAADARSFEMMKSFMKEIFQK
jgi:dienelactone hydrolase